MNGYSDSDWANCPHTRRSQTGYLVMLGGGAVSWGTKLQPTVAISSCEAEYMALASVTSDVLALRNMLQQVPIYQQQTGAADPVNIWVDNKGAVDLANDTGAPKRSKHIDIKHHFVRERGEEGTNEIKVAHIPGTSQPADMLTKALSGKTLKPLRDATMGNY